MTGDGPLYITDITLGVPNVAEMMALAEGAGFDGVVSCFAYEKARAGGATDEAILADVQASSLIIRGIEAIMAWAGPDDPGPPYRGEPSRANVLRAVDLLRPDTLGLLVVGAPDVSHESICAAVARAADEASARGLDVLVEFTAWSAIKTVSQAFRVLEDVGRANAKMTFDLWHHHLSPDTDVDLEPFARQVGAVQLSDAPKGTRASGATPSTFSRVPPGEGEFPITDDLAALWRGGFAGPIAVEVLNNDLLAEYGGEAWAQHLASTANAALEAAAARI